MIGRRDTKADGDSEWVSISDLMSGLMIIFLFFSVSYMYDVQQNQQRIRRIAVAYRELQTALYEDLLAEFKDDLPHWKATLDRETLAIRFGEPEVLFQVGSADVSQRFQAILRDFFPRYMRIIASDAYRDNVEDIRIEGHTSSEWLPRVSRDEAYFLNMELSQDRTRSVLRYCLDLLGDGGQKIWAREFITANGLSSSRPILTVDNVEDRADCREILKEYGQNAFDFQSLIEDHDAYETRKLREVAPVSQTTENFDLADACRRVCNFSCQAFGVICVDVPGLLHLHYDDGDPTHMDANNLRILCVDCHASLPGHDHMKTQPVVPVDIEVVERLRRQQGIVSLRVQETGDRRQADSFTDHRD